MSVTSRARDDEVAAAAGSDADTGSGTRGFGYPPNLAQDLTITSSAGDLAASNPGMCGSSRPRRPEAQPTTFWAGP